MNIEEQYKKLLKDVITNGHKKESRVGATYSVFGRELRHNFMENGEFPLYTTKYVSLKNVFTELKWFLLGRTDLKYLRDNNCNIWIGDAHRFYNQKCANIGNPEVTVEEYLARIDSDKWFAHTYGNLDEIYGQQWRGGIVNPNGVPNKNDQIWSIIDKLRNNPDDRRMICSAWNVQDLDKMALNPCHYSFQVYSRELNEFEKQYSNGCDRALSLKFNMRSNDLPLGNPYNVASYGMLTLMLCDMTNHVPEELIPSIGDAHIYENQVEGVLQLLDMPSYKLPQLKLKHRNVLDISEYEFEDFVLTDYKYNKEKVNLPLSV